MSKFIGYTPDTDPTIPGVITNCQAIVPSYIGIKGAPSASNVGLATLAATCRGASIVKLLDDTTIIYAGTATDMYKATSPTWTSFTRLVGGSYAVPATGRWRFAQYGNVTLTVNKGDKLQFITTGANFALVTKAAVDAPKASIVEVVGQFVILADYNDGTDVTDGVFWCAFGDYTDWTTSVTTQCGKARLISTPGAIRAAKKFGEQIVIYKDKAMYVGTYTGKPAIWTFNEIPGVTGALSQEAVVSVGTTEDPRHIFMGKDDFYSFDGARPIPIGTGILKQDVFNNLNQGYSYLCQAVYDEINSIVYFYYPSSNSTVCDLCVVYHTRTKQWGRDDRSIEAALQYAQPGVTYNGLGSVYTTYDSIGSVTYDSIVKVSGTIYPAVIDTLHNLMSLTAPSVTSFITSGDFGDEQTFSLLSRVRPKFLTAPTSATMTNYYRNNLGDTLTSGTTSNYSNGKFDLLRSARFHRIKLTMNGNFEIAEFTPYLVKEGME